MIKRSATPAPWKVEEFASSSGKGVVKSEAVVEVEPVSRSISHAAASEAPSPSHVATSEFEPVDLRSRLELDPISSGASPASLI